MTQKQKYPGITSKFNLNAFKQDLDKSLSNKNVYEYKLFQNTFIHTLNKHARIKIKIIRFNNNSFVKQASKLKNVYHKSRMNENWANYKKERNFSVNFIRKTEAAVQRCSVKKVFLEILQIHKKTPAPESLFRKMMTDASKKRFFYLIFENPLKMMTNAFYFTFKALFVLKIFKFLS